MAPETKENRDMLDDQSTDDLTRYELRLDRCTFNDLKEIAEKQRCGIGGVVRFYVKNALAQAKAKAASE
jgi:hypothetical protein